MSTPQIIFSVVMILVVLAFLRRQWLLKGLTRYTASEAADRMKRHGASILLDVRTPAERSRSSIKGSIHIPLHELGRRTGELQKYKTKEIICYCQSGNRSMIAAVRLKKLGFTTANMNGGIAEWNSSGFK